MFSVITDILRYLVCNWSPLGSFYVRSVVHLDTIVRWRRLLVERFRALWYTHSMIIPVRKIIRLFIASILLIIGAFGLVLPVLNGIFFIVAALIIISLEFPALDHFLDKQSKRNYKVGRVYDKVRHFIRKHF